MKKTLTLSLIIPVYNEENHIAGCLDSIARQTVAPDEVIVVDNNSTDRTIAIAKQYPFVRVAHEKNQGLIPARDRGFREATGDILGRLDADSHLCEDWVETIHEVFADPSIDAVTGPAKTFIDSHFPSITSTIWSKAYFWHALSVFRFPVLWGPNMAVRRNVLEAISDELCHDDKVVHEDQDISTVLTAHGYRIIRCNRLLMHTDGSRMAYLPKTVEYQHRKKRTLQLHRRNGNLAKARQHGIPVWKAYLIMIAQIPIGLLGAISSGLYTIEKLLALRS